MRPTGLEFDMPDLQDPASCLPRLSPNAQLPSCGPALREGRCVELWTLPCCPRVLCFGKHSPSAGRYVPPPPTTTSPLTQLMNSYPSFNAQSCHSPPACPHTHTRAELPSSEPPCLCPVFSSVPSNTLCQLCLFTCLSPSWTVSNLKARAGPKL